MLDKQPSGAGCFVAQLRTRWPALIGYLGGKPCRISLVAVVQGTQKNAFVHDPFKRRVGRGLPLMALAFDPRETQCLLPDWSGAQLFGIVAVIDHLLLHQRDRTDNTEGVGPNAIERSGKGWPCHVRRYRELDELTARCRPCIDIPTWIEGLAHRRQPVFHRCTRLVLTRLIPLQNGNERLLVRVGRVGKPTAQPSVVAVFDHVVMQEGGEERWNAQRLGSRPRRRRSDQHGAQTDLECPHTYSPPAAFARLL